MAHELRFWEGQYAEDQGIFRNAYYAPTMLAMAAEESQAFLRGKVVADFGCGPRGSLVWATEARLRIGIDVLAEQYSRFRIATQDMCYVVATEAWIPLPSNYVDVMFTMNAMDHVNDFSRMCDEILRVMASGGLFIGSFNLDEPATESEPQTLTEELVDRHLLGRMEVVSRRVAPMNLTGQGGIYQHCISPSPPVHVLGDRKFLWVRAIKTPAK